MTGEILHIIQSAKAQQKKLLAVLIDPDTPNEKDLAEIIQQINQANADLIFVGGSLLTKDALDACLKQIKSLTDKPVILFPGSVLQISDQADAILFLSLISGRNPELLIGNQVIAAPYVKQAGLEVLPTGYILVDSGRTTTATYMSHTLPIPHQKDDIAACTAMAGEMLGLQLIYMDGGSGADKAISPSMVNAVRQSVDTPIIIGGGIRDTETAKAICKAGADVIVVGNATESNPKVISEIANAIHNV